MPHRRGMTTSSLIRQTNPGSRNTDTSRGKGTTSASAYSDDHSLILAVTIGRGQGRKEVGIAAIDLQYPNMILCQLSDQGLYINVLTKIHMFQPVEAAADHFTKAPVCNNPIYNLLRSSVKGKAVISFYQEHNYLINTVRNALTQLVISREEEKVFSDVHRVPGCNVVKKFKISRAQFICWSNQIVEVFPQENCETYYTPFRYINREKIAATGKLVRNYEYVLKKRRREGLLAGGPPNIPTVEDEEEIPEISEDCFNWLKENSKPTNETVPKWKNSFPSRQKFLLEATTTIGVYFQTLGSLRTPVGAELLRSDFTVLFPEVLNFYTNWDKAVPILAQQLQHCKHIPLQDRGYLRGWAGMVKDAKDAVIAYLLPYLIDPPAPKKKLHQKKLSSQKRQESFLLLVENEACISQRLNRLQDKFDTDELQFPPIIVFVGDLVDLDKIYVSMNDELDPDTQLPTLYEMRTVLDAIDFCLQSTYALQCEFQLRAMQCWLFIKRALYNIKAATDKPNQSVKVLLGLVVAGRNVAREQ